MNRIAFLKLLALFCALVLCMAPVLSGLAEEVDDQTEPSDEPLSAASFEEDVVVVDDFALFAADDGDEEGEPDVGSTGGSGTDGTGADNTSGGTGTDGTGMDGTTGGTGTDGTGADGTTGGTGTDGTGTDGTGTDGTGTEGSSEATGDDVGDIHTIRSFSETVKAEDETWKDLNLVRADGFEGKLATVKGLLKLENVLIDGTPARSVNLLNWFDLEPGARIACSSDASLAIGLNALSINKGSSRKMTLTWKGKALSPKKAKWSVSNKKYVTVKNGKIKAKKKGTAYVSAKYKGQKVVCRLDITGFSYAKSVKIKKKLTLALNTGLKLKATIKPSNTENKTLTWWSSNPNVVSVDEDGFIAGLAKGKANVYVKTHNGKTAKCKVTVKVVNPKSVKFSKFYVTMRLDADGKAEPYQLKPSMSPGNSSYPQILYTSSDESVATVDENGVVTALKCGTTTITAASAVKPKLKDTCKICVINESDKPLTGLVIGINPGHQKKCAKYTLRRAPWSKSRALAIKDGACGHATGQHEYECVLRIGLKLKAMLEAQGAEVVITRTSNDVFLTNIDRAKMLNKAGVDVALQLHNNSCHVSSKRGASAYYRTSHCAWASENRALAKIFCKSMHTYTGFKNQGVHKYNEYMSLNWSETPAVLLEMGYLSNGTEDRLLKKDSVRENFAYAIYHGLCVYHDRTVVPQSEVYGS